MTTPLPASDDLDPAPPRVGRVVLLYALCAGLWISLSEAALRWLVADPALRALARVFEGWALIGVTSALLFGLLRRHMRLQKAALASEREALLSQDRALQLLRTLSDNSPDIIFAKDREGRYLLRNAAGLREIGRSTEQVIGRDDSAIFPAEQARQLRAHDERVKVQDHAETFEEELDTVDGRRIFLSTKGPLHDSAGGVIGMFGISHDITARRRAEDALRDAEALKHQVFEQLTDGVLLIDKTYRFLDANLHAVEMFGYPRDELLCLGVRDVLPAEELPRISEPLDVVVARRPDLAEWSLVRMDGGRFTAEVSARPLGEGRYVVVVRDITQRRAAEQALLTNQTELTELTQRLLTQEQQTTRRIAQSLHDRLGQTLAAARLTLEGCITTYARAMPAALKAEAHRIAVLLEQSQQEVRQVLTDLRPPLLEEQGLAAALDNELRSRAQAKGEADALLEVSEDGLARRWPVEVEYVALMVAREAVANARQHAGASLIRVLLDGTETRLSVHVIDDGCGLPAALAHGRPGHLGVVGMRERAISIGARFDVEPSPSGGTSIGLHWQAPRT